VIIPDVVLVEVVFLADRAGGVPAKLSLLDFVANFPGTLQPITRDDLKRVREIMQMYADARLDFVDCCIMALSERLNITQICTFDRRDFVIFRPKHCDYLDLLP
jgi:predicted nucleic acid-binding protein